MFSTIAGFVAGWLVTKLIRTACRNVNRRNADELFGRLQVIGAAGVALMHGAQDGQKFMSTAMLAIALSAGLGVADGEEPQRRLRHAHGYGLWGARPGGGAFQAQDCYDQRAEEDNAGSDNSDDIDDDISDSIGGGIGYRFPVNNESERLAEECQS